MSDAYTTPTGELIIGNTELPVVINAQRNVSYTVEDVVKAILEDRTSSEWTDSSGETGGQASTLEVTLEDVMERIEQWSVSDLACGWGHEADLGDIEFTCLDENGLPIE